MVDFHSLIKAGRALKAFTYLYLPYHSESSDLLFQHFGVFSFLEALAYSADEVNEHAGGSKLVSRRLSKLSSFLEQQNLLDTQCMSLIMDARRYYMMERRFSLGGLSYSGLITAIGYRSYDFRLLHRVMYQLKGMPYDEKVFEAFAPFEQIMELDDDRMSASSDSEKGTFNSWNGLISVSKDTLISYVRDLRMAVSNVSNILGRSYHLMLNTYYKLVPASLLINKAI